MISMPKPCHDCPFRTDVGKYLNQDQVDANVFWLSQGTVPFCHHSPGTVKDPDELSNYTVDANKLARCAGALIVMGHKPIDGMPPCYDNVFDMALNAVATDEDHKRAYTEGIRGVSPEERSETREAIKGLFGSATQAGG